MFYFLTDDPEAEIRGLAGEVRRLWGLLDVGRRRLDPMVPGLYRAACARLTDALLSYPEPVRLDSDTWLLPDIDGECPAFVPDEGYYAEPAERRRARNRLMCLMTVHARRFAGRAAR